MGVAMGPKMAKNSSQPIRSEQLATMRIILSMHYVINIQQFVHVCRYAVLKEFDKHVMQCST